jgi:predicted nicotinamide N-methyase
VYPLSLQLISEAAAMGTPPLDVTPLHLDLFSPTPLPAADLVLAADVLYLTDLTRAVAHRVVEAKARGSTVMLTDSRRTHQGAFLTALEAAGVEAHFEPHRLDWLPGGQTEHADLLII